MPQRHAIHRQIVEVTVASAATAERISSVVSDLIRNAVTPLLERMFDEMTPHAEIVRLDRLELDLGRLDLASLQRELPARIAAKLPAAVLQSAALRRSGGDPSGTSARSGRMKPDADAAALLVISHFVTTGTLPWWCDGRGRDLLDRAADAALQRSPANLTHSLRGFVSDPTAMNRLIGHLSDQSLEKIAAALAPDRAAVLRELATLLESTSIADLTPRQRRLVVWRGLLQAACAGARSDLIETALTATAGAAGVPLASLLVACTAAASARPPSRDVAARLAALTAAYSDLAPADAARRREPGLSVSDPALAALHAELAPLTARLPDSAHSAWSAAFERLAQTASGRARDDAISAMLQPLFTAALMTSAEADRLRARLARHAPARQQPEPIAATEDSHAVVTAGVCLLWPFLPRFFARRGLLDDKETGFASLAAQQRAVLLLHHLATGERDAPEFALLLPKVLCGMPPFDPCETADPVSDVESAEAAQLLDAAIAHATCLGTISHAGLRETFLMRPGMLGTRDGAWLLRLEGRSADVLLKRIPWTLQWLRLPWMQAAMRVEW